MHFLEQRLADDAQYEIQRFAEGVHALIAEDLSRLGLTREAIASGDLGKA